MTEFDQRVYEQIRRGTQASARVIVPMLLQWVRSHPSMDRKLSFLDVGCGEGWWSDALFDAGCTGDSIDQAAPEEWAPGIHIDEVDLEGEYSLRRGYDLAICLEVAEHLDAAAGDKLVFELTRAAGIIAWSAAIPAQGGHGHKNEQWPDYWAERFAAQGYAFVDPIRRAVWDDPDVEPWYAQNLLVAIPATHEQPAPAHLVHPAIYQTRVEERDAAWRAYEQEHEALRFATENPTWP